MTDHLDIAMLLRAAPRGASGKIDPDSERHTVDFTVDGVSLFALTCADERDLCGCFSPDYATCGNELARHENDRIAKVFTFESTPDIKPDRVALFVCPQCGDLACGAITFQLSRTEETVHWSNFGYQDGWDEEVTDFESYASIGPFEFEIERYRAVIARAASARARAGP